MRVINKLEIRSILSLEPEYGGLISAMSGLEASHGNFETSGQESIPDSLRASLNSEPPLYFGELDTSPIITYDRNVSCD